MECGNNRKRWPTTTHFGRVAVELQAILHGCARGEGAQTCFLQDSNEDSDDFEEVLRG